MKILRTESLQPLLIDVFEFKRFAGRYFLTSVVCRVDSNGKPCKVLTIADASTEMKVFCSNEEFACSGPFRSPISVQSDH